MIKHYLYLLGAITILFFTSCKTGNKLSSITYFNHGDSLAATAVKAIEPVIAPGDRLSIIVSSSNPEAVMPFNIAISANPGFKVENDGTIHYPQLGDLKVAGLERKQLVDLISDRLKKYLTDPIVAVQFLNFRVSVLGEVNRPGLVSIAEGGVTLTEALGMAGDLNNSSSRDDIMIIREKNGKREFGTINLLSKDAFLSPYYYLQQNDIVYVKPNKNKVSTDQTFVRNLSIVTSVISIASTLIFLIVSITK